MSAWVYAGIGAWCGIAVYEIRHGGVIAAFIRGLMGSGKL